MNLRSGKILRKKTKQTFRNKNETIDGDFISKLPNELLTQILSLVSEADANRSRILSKRWKDLWAFLPNLHFVIPLQKVRKYCNSVDKALARRGLDMPIQKFFLDCHRKCYYNRVYKWLRILVLSKVEEIEIWFPHHMIRVRLDMFKTCHTLVTLTLKGGFRLHLPKPELLFPCLKKMDLVGVVYYGDKSLANLLSGCPVLEELFVERQVLGYSLNMFKYTSPSLKKLRITFSMYTIRPDHIVINAPKLEYIFVDDKTSVYFITKPMSIVEAHIGVTSGATGIISNLSFARILILTSSTIKALDNFNDSIPLVFPNLVKLVVGVKKTSHWNMLWILLNKMPNLEHITFSDGLLCARGQRNPPVDVPACLRFKMKEIIVHNREAIMHEEFIIINYLLKHSNSLESFTLNAHDINPERREKLLNFQRGSKSCQIEFI